MDVNSLGYKDGVLCLEVVGRIIREDDTLDLQAIEAKLGENGFAQRIAMSLERTHFIDSTGISWLIALHKRVRQAGGRIVFHSLTPDVKTLFNLMRLELALDIAENENQAIALATQPLADRGQQSPDTEKRNPTSAK